MDDVMSSLSLPQAHRPCLRRLGAHGRLHRVGQNGSKKEANFFILSNEKSKNFESKIV